MESWRPSHLTPTYGIEGEGSPLAPKKPGTRSIHCLSRMVGIHLHPPQPSLNQPQQLDRVLDPTAASDTYRHPQPPTRHPQTPTDTHTDRKGLTWPSVVRATTPFELTLPLNLCGRAMRAAMDGWVAFAAASSAARCAAASAAATFAAASSAARCAAASADATFAAASSVARSVGLLPLAPLLHLALQLPAVPHQLLHHFATPVSRASCASTSRRCSHFFSSRCEKTVKLRCSSSLLLSVIEPLLLDMHHLLCNACVSLKRAQRSHTDAELLPPAPRQQTFRIFGQLPLQAYVAATTALCNQTAPTAKPWCPGATPSPSKRFSKNLQELLLIK